MNLTYEEWVAEFKAIEKFKTTLTCHGMKLNADIEYAGGYFYLDGFDETSIVSDNEDLNSWIGILGLNESGYVHREFEDKIHTNEDVIKAKETLTYLLSNDLGNAYNDRYYSEQAAESRAIHDLASTHRDLSELARLKGKYEPGFHLVLSSEERTSVDDALQFAISSLEGTAQLDYCWYDLIRKLNN